MFFDGWAGLMRVAMVGPLAYLGLVVLLRITGKRTLAKMNAFDLVVTVALGSTLATVLLSEDVSLSEGLLGFVVLCGLQYTVAYFSVRSKRFEKLVKSEPTLLYCGGAFIDRALRDERVSREEIRSAIRGAGASRLEEVAAVTLETDGSFSVLVRLSPPEADSVFNLETRRG